MSAYHWAQPEGQRLTDPHNTSEVYGEGDKKHPRGELRNRTLITDGQIYELARLREFLEDGPKTFPQIKAELGYSGRGKQGSWQQCQVRIANHCFEIYEEEKPGYQSNLMGLIGTYALDIPG